MHVRAVTRAPRVVPAAHGHPDVLGPLTSGRRFLTVPHIHAVVLLLRRLGVMTMLLGVMTMPLRGMTMFLGVMAMLLRVMTMLLGTTLGVVVVMPSRLWLRRRMRMSGVLGGHAGWLGRGPHVGCGAAGPWAGARAWARIP